LFSFCKRQKSSGDVRCGRDGVRLGCRRLAGTPGNRESHQDRLKQRRARLLFQGPNAPNIQPIEHEQEDKDKQPEIGEATLFLALLFQMADLCEAVDKGALAMRTGAIALKKATVPLICCTIA
jgi:hypothetical protein